MERTAVPSPAEEGGRFLQTGAVGGRLWIEREAWQAGLAHLAGAEILPQARDLG